MRGRSPQNHLVVAEWTMRNALVRHGLEAVFCNFGLHLFEGVEPIALQSRPKRRDDPPGERKVRPDQISVWAEDPAHLSYSALPVRNVVEDVL